MVKLGRDVVVFKINECYGLVFVVDGNFNYSYFNFYYGVMGVVVEVVRNFVSVGVEFLVLVDNFNFVFLERFEVYWSFVEIVRGLVDVVRVFGLVYVSGNVSFYNEVVDRFIKLILVVVGFGKVEFEKIFGFGFEEGFFIGVVGSIKREFGGSELYVRFGLKGGIVLCVNFEEEKVNVEGIFEVIRRGFLKVVYDVSKGGIVVVLVEMVVLGNMGFIVDFLKVFVEIFNLFEVVFSESYGCYIVVFFEERFEEFKVFFRYFVVIGRVGGSGVVFFWNGDEFLRKLIIKLRDRKSVV